MNQFSAAQFLWIGSQLEVIKAIEQVEAKCRELGLAISAETAREMAEELALPRPGHYTWLMTRTSALQRLIIKELQTQLFMHVLPDRTRFWPKEKDPDLFGDAVARAFPSASFDINNAGICLALRLGTASVFHLMRVLETGLAALARRFGIAFEFTNWAPVLDQIESKVRGMRQDPAFKTLPDCREQQEFYAQAASHFGVLKDAWRNHAMHIRGKYTEEEAEVILVNVKAFMNRLALIGRLGASAGRARAATRT
jgi:hypothetical protein